MKRVITIALFALMAGQASAEAQFGVEVYPPAKADAEVAKQLKESMKIEAKTYRTSDPVPKVSEFFRKQKLTEGPGTSEKGSMFYNDKVTVTVQNPWLDMKTGKINNDTLVSIVPKKK